MHTPYRRSAYPEVERGRSGLRLFRRKPILRLPQNYRFHREGHMGARYLHLRTEHSCCICRQDAHHKISDRDSGSRHHSSSRSRLDSRSHSGSCKGSRSYSGSRKSSRSRSGSCSRQISRRASSDHRSASPPHAKPTYLSRLRSYSIKEMPSLLEASLLC